VSEANVRKYLDVSTGNLPHEEMEAIETGDAGGDDELVIVRNYEYGAWVWVPDEPDYYAELPKLQPRLSAILNEARRLGCNWVNFDRDAPHLAGFPSFEW